MEDNDAQLQLKKRARRRLIGAIFFVSVVAVVLPTVMDQEPRQQVQDVEIRIPGQDDKPFAPRFAAAPAEMPAVVEAPAARPPAEKSPEKVPEKAAPEKAPAKAAEKPVERPPEKPAEKPAAKPEKAPEKPAAKPADKTPEKPKAEDTKRAAAILAGQGADAKASAKGGDYLVLIGAFASEDNVRNLKAKLGELGIRTYSEPLETPQGRKTRVRAGPFASREAADKALEKMKKIGISGVVAAKP